MPLRLWRHDPLGMVALLVWVRAVLWLVLLGLTTSDAYSKLRLPLAFESKLFWLVVTALAVALPFAAIRWSWLHSPAWSYEVGYWVFTGLLLVYLAPTSVLWADCLVNAAAAVYVLRATSFRRARIAPADETS